MNKLLTTELVDDNLWTFVFQPKDETNTLFQAYISVDKTTREIGFPVSYDIASVVIEWMKHRGLNELISVFIDLLSKEEEIKKLNEIIQSLESELEEWENNEYD